MGVAEVCQRAGSDLPSVEAVVAMQRFIDFELGRKAKRRRADKGELPAIISVPCIIFEEVVHVWSDTAGR